MTTTASKVQLPLSAPVVERVAERFRVLGEPMRISLLQILRDGEATVSELQEATGATQQNVSKHLNVLLRAGIVGKRKQGNFAVYSIADPVVFSLCDAVCEGLEREADELGALLRGGE